MDTLWFLIVALMLVIYVVLDGFDLGVGAIYKLVGRTPEERAVVRQSIGPVWDANEVWLIAGGGALFFAFPALYAASFSGFYLPLMMVLWLFIGRGLGLELRHHLHDPVVAEICDTSFWLSSMLLIVFFGAALGNVIRGVPLDAEGYFFLPLWTDFRTGARPGILDWYTVLCGLIALGAIVTHGAHFLAARTGGEVNARAKRIARAGTRLLPFLTLGSFVATASVQPMVLDNFRTFPLGLLIPAAVVASLAAMQILVARDREWSAFLASTAYLAAMLGGAAFALYPTLLPSTTGPARALTVHNSATSSYGQQVALTWWLIGFVLVVSTFRYLYGSLRGKLHPESSEGPHD
jgi:cytochrome d ubiquinol oxidase subunit II